MNNMQQTEGYQGLVNKYTQEISVLEDQVCQLDRSVIARESQLKVITRENETHMNKCSELNGELERV